MESLPLCLSRLLDGNMSGISKEKSRGDFAFTCLMPIWRGFPKRGLKNKERHLQLAEVDSFPTRSQEGGLMIRLLFLRKRRSAVFTAGFLPDKKIYVCRRARFAVFRELAEAFDQFRFRVRIGGVDKTLQVWQLRFA